MSYVGLAIDLEQECQDICLVDEVAEYELRKQSDCLQVAGQIYGEESVDGFYYAYDDRI